MGREVAEAVPEAMAVFDEASDAAGMDLKQLCFERPVEDLVDTEVQQPALVTTCLSLDAALRQRGIRPDVVVGHSVGEFSALGAASTLSVRDAIALVRERGLAMAEAARQHPGSMAAILGLADEAVEALCHKIHNVWPANYNCPGQLVISGETPSVDEAIDEATREGARRAIKLRVSGAFHSPLVARAAERLRPAVETVHLAEGKAAFMSTVTARIEEATALPRGARRAADRAGPVHAGGARADRRRRDDVRRGRARQRARRFTEEDRQVRAHVLGQRPEDARRGHRSAWLVRGRSRRSTESSRSSPAPRAGSAARSRRSSRARARPSSSATARARTRPKSSRPRSAAAPIQADVSSPDEAKRLVEEAGDIDVLVNNAGLTRDGLLARMSDDDWRTVIETNLSSVFYTCRAVTRPMMKKRARLDRQHQLDRRRARQLGPDELRRVEGRDHRLHEVARARARLAQHPRERRRARATSRPRSPTCCRRRRPRRWCSRPRSAASRIRKRSRARYASSPRTRRRSSRARCCWSTADWGCDGGERRTGRDHRARDGEPARQRRAVVVVAPARRRVRRRRDHRVRPHGLQRPLRVRAEGLRSRPCGSTARRRGGWTASRR